ncbi:unnamed protein product [Dracunculus medinensis]|uniref:7TM_GPCR_Srx domain-containing protein n=1 Tax=Dracunculus medinensis TaxID=318479 RepID=A0A0N4UAU7_DRAME|nr:unnamed protein product [Dracunculus medinensis]
MSSTVQYSQSSLISFWATLSMGLLGFIANMASFYMIRTLKRFNNSFGILCGGFCALNCIVIFILTVYVTSCSLLQKCLKLSIASALLATIAKSFCNSTFFLHLVIAVNRYCSIAFPVSYSSIFTKRFSYGCIAFTSLFALSIRITNFIDGCQFYFDLKRHLWSFENTECGRILSFWTGGYMIVIISVLTMITDLLTFYKLRSFNKTCITGIAFVGISTVNQVAGIYRLKELGLSTAFWISLHTFDGCVNRSITITSVHKENENLAKLN